MQKHLLLICVFLLSAFAPSKAQTVVIHSGTPVYTSTYPFNYAYYDRRQDLYEATNFSPAAHGGIISKISYQANNATTATLTNVTIKMSQPTFTSLTAGAYYTTGLTTVYTGSPTLVNQTGNWREFTLTTPFNYDDQKPLLIDVTVGGFTTGMTINQTLSSPIIGSVYGSTAGNYGYQSNYRANMKLEFSTVFPLCPGPTNLTTVSVLAPNAKIRWNAAPGVQSYSYVLDQTPGIPTALAFPVSDTFVNLTNLLPNQNYYLHVRSNCVLNKSDWVHYAFNTNCPVQSLAITPTTTIALCPGNSAVLSATPTGGFWGSANTQVAGVNATNGTVIGYGAGSVNIIYTYDSGACRYTVSRSISVLPEPVYPGNITGVSEICNGAPAQYTVPTGGGYWYTSNPAVATVSTTGVVSTLTSGNFNLTYAVSNGAGCTNQSVKQILVKPRPALNTPITGNDKICKNGVTRLTNTTTGGIWSSADPAVANINTTSGILEGQNPGFTIIRYTVTTNGCSNEVSKTVEVLNAPFPSVNSNGNELSTTQPWTAYQWKRNGIDIAGANGSSYIFTESGTYEVEVTDINGCVGISAPLRIGGTAVANFSTGGAITIYPNPANGVVFVKSANDVYVQLSTLQGQVVVSKKLIAANSTNGSEVSIQALATGMYFLQVMDKTGKLVHTEKLVIQ